MQVHIGRQPPWAYEMRSGAEFAAFVAAAGSMLAESPRGDGHAVLVLPGYTADDRSTRPLRWFLRRLGYHVHGWRLGRNDGPTARITAGLSTRFEELTERHREPLSIVGWSLGGEYARAIGGRVPADVRQVITLGSPLRGTPDAAPSVPVTSVFSRSDAIVPWRDSLIRTGPLRENVEVRGSHIRLGRNPAVLRIVSDRLAQQHNGWLAYHHSQTTVDATRTARSTS